MLKSIYSKVALPSNSISDISLLESFRIFNLGKGIFTSLFILFEERSRLVRNGKIYALSSDLISSILLFPRLIYNKYFR
jgi:hypothetical protein